MFEKTLADVVKGIRASKRDTALYISQCIAEIKTELNSTDLYVKANALQKLTFLQMMGYSMTWASFATIEVMSSPRFAHKRIGYLAASQGFTQNTEVILLSTNLLKKELRGASSGNMQGVYEAGLAINCISNIVTEDLATDLLPELTTLTSHPQPYLRKKAVLCLFKLFVKYPQGLRLTFSQVQQCLDDSNPSVVSCAVNVLSELSDKNPKNYLHLAPAFFQLLTGSSNNWMLIKVVKLLGSLVAEEPRLARKLLEPLATIVRSTQAKSLLFEAVHTLTLSLPYCRKADGTMPPIVPEIVTLCATTLRKFVEEQDQNLKYLGLVGFGSLMASHSKVLSAPDYRPLILTCLSDEDVTIRTRALDLLKGGMASRKNLQELVKQLMAHVEMASGTYKHDLVLKLVEMCSGDKYALLTDFGWYLDILWTLGHMRGIDMHANLLKHQIMDVALRVLPVRAYAVRRSMEVFMERERVVVEGGGGTTVDVEDNGRGKHMMPEILPAVAWIVGEYSDLIPEALSQDGDFQYNASSKGTYHSLLQALLAPSNIRKLPTTTQSVYIQAAMKVFAAATAHTNVSKEELEACVDTLSLYLPVYTESTDVEVQERAFTANELLRSLNLVSSTCNDAIPDLTRADNDSDDEDDKGLLGMLQAPAMKNNNSSLVTRCRYASDVLRYLLKPEPMKPTSAKTQRKKRQAPIGVNVEILDAPVDLSVFASFLEMERSQRPLGSLNMESVSFTQQRPPRTTSVENIPSMNSSVAVMEMTTTLGAMDGSNGGSFQRSGMSESVETSGLAQPRHQHDPFYLDSGAPSEVEGADNHLGRFGTIQLLDSDGAESDDGGRKKHKKTNKKDKRQNKQRQPTSAVGDMGDADLAMLSMLNTTSTPKPPARTAAVSVTVYSSDDNDDDNQLIFLSGRKAGGKRKGPGKEFAGLAQVDLTTPLREDEVMPTRQHRVVPERRAEAPQRVHDSKKKKKKESKKGKKTIESTVDMPMSTGGDSDLLDLGGFMPIANVPTQTMTSSRNEINNFNTSNAISTAFDDLLGLTSPAEVLPQPVAPSMLNMSAAHASSKTSSSTKHMKRPWMRATIKPTSAEGSPVVDWSKVSLHFKVNSHNQGSTVAATVIFRVENHMETVSLTKVTLKLKSQNDIDFGDVGPGSSAEADAKAGPFLYVVHDSSMEIKGSLVTPECKVPTKLALPATVFLNPLTGLTQDDVMEELSSYQWSCHSLKLELTMGQEPAKAKPYLCSFFRAGEIEGGGSGPLSGTLAAQSQSGSKVFVLVKVKGTSIKVDLKCTNSALGKALVSDLKKLVL